MKKLAITIKNGGLSIKEIICSPRFSQSQKLGTLIQASDIQLIKHLESLDSIVDKKAMLIDYIDIFNSHQANFYKDEDIMNTELIMDIIKDGYISIIITGIIDVEECYNKLLNKFNWMKL